ncbi:Cysteine protease XCP1, partial [Cucurbita argyrosperma subsp. argyrosperma]
MSRHSKTYQSIEEKLHRFGTFVDNLKHIEETNKKDLSHEEYKSKYFGPNVEFPRKRSTHGFSYRDVEDLLESVDWRSREAVTPVKNQGSCGSFGAFSTVAAVESINQIAWSTMTEASTMDAMAVRWITPSNT